MTEPDTPPEAQAGRHRLPWQAVVAATVLALTASALVLVIASGGDDDAGVAATSDRPSETVELRPADEVPTGDPLDIEFTDIDGSSGTLRDRLEGEPMVVNFFASWCPPCIKEMPDFETVSQGYDDIRFFGLAVTDRPEDAARIVEETGITYPWARDVRGDIAGAAQVVQMPTTLFISADGTVAHVQAGALDADGLRALVQEHLGGDA